MVASLQGGVEPECNMAGRRQGVGEKQRVVVPVDAVVIGEVGGVGPTLDDDGVERMKGVSYLGGVAHISHDKVCEFLFAKNPTYSGLESYSPWRLCQWWADDGLLKPGVGIHPPIVIIVALLKPAREYHPTRGSP